MMETQDIKPDTVYKVRGTELIPPYLVRTGSELEWSGGKVWVTEGFLLQPANEWRDYGNSCKGISPVCLTDYLQGRAVPAFNRVPCNICGDTMTLDTGSRRPLADGAGWDGAVCADCAGYYVAGPNGPMFCRGPRS